MKELKDNWEGKKNKNNCHCKANIFLSYLLPHIYARSLLYKFLLLSLVFVSPFFCLSPNFIKECSTPTVPTSKYSIYCVGWSVAYNFNVLKLFCHRSLLSHTSVVSHCFCGSPIPFKAFYPCGLCCATVSWFSFYLAQFLPAVFCPLLLSCLLLKPGVTELPQGEKIYPQDLWEVR